MSHAQNLKVGVHLAEGKPSCEHPQAGGRHRIRSVFCKNLRHVRASLAGCPWGAEGEEDPQCGTCPRTRHERPVRKRGRGGRPLSQGACARGRLPHAGPRGKAAAPWAWVPVSRKDHQADVGDGLTRVPAPQVHGLLWVPDARGRALFTPMTLIPLVLTFGASKSLTRRLTED